MAIVLPKFPRSSLPNRAASTRRVEPQLELRLNSLQPCFEPSALLEAEFRVVTPDIDSIAGVEVSVLWFTEGKGSEDLEVHFFQRLSVGEVRLGNVSSLKNEADYTQLFSTRLPESPLSYEGKLVKIRWCVRVRLFLVDGREIVAQQPFYLGTVTREV